MIPLFIRTIRDNKNMLFATTIICALFVWMFVLFFPSLEKESQQLQEAFKNYPQGFLEAFNVDLDAIFLSLEGFLSTEYYSFLWPIILIIVAVVFTSSTIAGEIDQGTIDYLLSLPVSRTTLFCAKYTAGICIIVLFTFLSNLSVIPFALLHHVDCQIENMIYISIIGSLFGFALYGMGIMFSSLCSSRGKAAALTTGIIIGMYGLNLFAKFKESVEGIKYASFFYYFDVNSAILDTHIPLQSAAVFLLTGSMMSVIALTIFLKRDIAS